uniref:Uncharacterized protein n=1 Tax=Cacopsylla melanoneura TaxID=428564 RepID=A0A8D8ZCN5_9HEMI
MINLLYLYYVPILSLPLYRLNIGTIRSQIPYSLISHYSQLTSFPSLYRVPNEPSTPQLPVDYYKPHSVSRYVILEICCIVKLYSILSLNPSRTVKQNEV